MSKHASQSTIYRKPQEKKESFSPMLTGLGKINEENFETLIVTIFVQYY